MPRTLDGEMVVVHYRVIRPSGGRVVHLRDTGFPIRDEEGHVVRVAGIVQDVSDIEEAREALEGEKERFRTLAEGIPQLVWRSCDEGRWTWASPQWRDYTGQSQESSHGWGWLEAVHPDDRERTMASWHAARPHGRLEVEYRVRRASDGAWRWHQTRSVPVRNGATAAQPEGRIVEWLGTTTDIEDLKRLQNEQAVLVAELQHRTRNLLAVVRNVARRSISPQPGRDEYDERLAALGRVQGFLARSSSYRVALRDLVEAELQAAGDGVSDRVTIEGSPVDLPGEGAQPVALALHELATNAVKYGAIAQPTGRLSVTWLIDEGKEGVRLLIVWWESGVAMPGSPPARRGYGSELITRALPYQMAAETALEFTPDGVRCSIALPAGAFRTAESPRS
ncbi:sensor histidine kinase [Roseomonas sp. KE2513]|uniref:sensor histidine kinase n=1 Tax=Roseomonas sp. KE2513 TaxID=2479202 RepID=UPI0018DF644A|nr:PAS domain-containing protein [Roseomonas sp. KE2513]